MSSVDSVLLDILPKALDRDTFHITTDKFGEKYRGQLDLLIEQTTSPERTVCLLDRTGNLELSVKTITATRTSPDCTSPYSPDIVLVNEYLKEIFITSCLDYASQLNLSSSRAATSEEHEFQKLVKQAEARGEAVIHKRKADFTIVELMDRYGTFYFNNGKLQLIRLAPDPQSSQP